MKIALLVIVILCATSCVNGPVTADIPQDSVNRILDDIRYIKDSRTGICFAAVSNANAYRYVVSIATVPCDKAREIVK